MCVYVYIYVYIFIYIYIYTCVYIYINTCVYIYIYIYMCVNHRLYIELLSGFATCVLWLKVHLEHFCSRLTSTSLKCHPIDFKPVRPSGQTARLLLQLRRKQTLLTCVDGVQFIVTSSSITKQRLYSSWIHSYRSQGSFP